MSDGILVLTHEQKKRWLDAVCNSMNIENKWDQVTKIMMHHEETRFQHPSWYRFEFFRRDATLNQPDQIFRIPVGEHNNGLVQELKENFVSVSVFNLIKSLQVSTSGAWDVETLSVEEWCINDEA